MGHTSQPCKGSEILQEGGWKNAKSWEVKRSAHKVCSAVWHGVSTHEFTGAKYVSCTRPAQNQTCQDYSMEWGEALPLAKELFAFDGCGGSRVGLR